MIRESAAGLQPLWPTSQPGSRPWEPASTSSRKAVHCEPLPGVTRGGSGDFPGGPVVKNPPSNAGDVGSIPGWENKTPHAVGQLSPRTLEPAYHN